MAISSSTANYDYVGDGNSDGTYVGRDGGKLGFFGETPVAQVATTATDITTTGYQTSGVFSTSTLSLNFVNAVKQIQAALKSLGLIS